MNTPSTGPDREAELDVLKTVTNQQVPNTTFIEWGPPLDEDDFEGAGTAVRAAWRT